MGRISTKSSSTSIALSRSPPPTSGAGDSRLRTPIRFQERSRTTGARCIGRSTFLADFEDALDTELAITKRESANAIFLALCSNFEEAELFKEMTSMTLIIA
jgi:hypothetical protein